MNLPVDLVKETIDRVQYLEAEIDLQRARWGETLKIAIEQADRIKVLTRALNKLEDAVTGAIMDAGDIPCFDAELPHSLRLLVERYGIAKQAEAKLRAIENG